MITLVVKVDVKPEKMEEFIALTKQARKDALINEKGCKGYAIYKDSHHQNGLVLIETYLDQNAINRHKTMPHFLSWREKAEDMMNTQRRVTRYESI